MSSSAAHRGTAPTRQHPGRRQQVGRHDGGHPAHGAVGSAANAEIDALNTRYSGQREAALYESRGRNARTAGYLRAGTSLLTGASRYL